MRHLVTPQQEAFWILKNLLFGALCAKDFEGHKALMRVREYLIQTRWQ